VTSRLPLIRLASTNAIRRVLPDRGAAAPASGGARGQDLMFTVSSQSRRMATSGAITYLVMEDQFPSIAAPRERLPTVRDCRARSSADVRSFSSLPTREGSSFSLRDPTGRWRQPVPPEYSILCLTCAIASRLDAVIVGWPGAAQDRLPY
jgi:hypothetical protein